MSATQQPRAAPRLSKKRIAVTFVKVGSGTFAGSGNDTVKISGLRASASVSKVGGLSMGELQLRMYGMTLSNMNDLSTLGLTLKIGEGLLVLNNQVVVEAGDDDVGMAIVHHGTINNAWADFNAMPEVAFNVTSLGGLYEASLAVPPTSYAGMVDVETIMSSIASLAGWNFHNNGVTDKMENPYYPGTPWEQVKQLADHANINAILDDGAPQTLVIWPKGKSRGGDAPLISRDTGMIGSPTFAPNGLIVTTRFNPSINYGQQVKIRSDLTQASGLWEVRTLTHTLDAETPNGTWQTRFFATTIGQAPQVRSSGP